MPEKELTNRTYFLTFGGLLLLTLSTYGAAYVPLGHWHILAALAFSTLKATLIVLYFMHARNSNWLTWVVIICASFWLLILFALTLGDYLTRSFG